MIFKCKPFVISMTRKISIRLIFAVASISFASCVLVQLSVDKKLDFKLELLENENHKTVRSEDLKYILLWTSYDYSPFYFFAIGQKAFQNKRCAHQNCFVTTNRSLLGNEAKFDAVAFNGRNINVKDLPSVRSTAQRYIYFNMESADNYPVCKQVFDDFFNWTATYKLDSDIPSPYIAVKNLSGNVIGPRINMEWWEVPTEEMDMKFEEKLKNKTKAVAWFASHCSTRSKREVYVDALDKALNEHMLTVDVFGACGSQNCPKHDQHVCDTMLKREYYFYLAFENSFAPDYVTEKILTALKNDVVPIVYGGANYTRFLPPGSFIDAHNYTPKELADLLVKLIWSPELYKPFFRWKKVYTYKDASDNENVCAVCDALNNKEKLDKLQVYIHFRKWWYPDYRSRCNHE